MSKPKFEDTLPLEEKASPAVSMKKPPIEETVPVEQEDISGFQKALNVIDIPGSLVRTGVGAALDPNKKVLPEVMGQVERVVSSPTTAALSAPTGIDINKQIFPEYNQESIPGRIGGITTEMALDPTSWFRPTKPVQKTVRKSLESASERQAAKAIAKYATRGQVLKEGADIEAIGARLVAEDLQGFLRNPKKLYETIAGERHLQKIGSDLPQTLQIRRGKSEGGLIAQTSKEVTDAIKKVEEGYGLAPQYPAAVMYKELITNALKNLSATSGETVDLKKAEAVLQNALKPFEDIVTPPVIGDVVETPGIIREPKTLSLSQLQELRKNIGKQVADRAFYASADMNVKQETETLASVYRTLGEAIEKQLKGKQIKVGNTLVDAGDYYKAQNNKLKSMLDLKSMLEYTPTEKLKEPDIAAMIAGALGQGIVYGATGVGASMAGLPVNPVTAGVVAGGFGAAKSVGENIKSSTPEYLTSILKSMGAVQSTPMLPEAAGRGIIQYMREGQPIPAPEEQAAPGYNFQNVKPAFPMGVPPKGTFINPKQLLKYKIPRSTDGILQNKEMVLAKIAQSGVPSEMYDTIAYALNENPEKIKDIAPVVMMQFPTLFEDSAYKIFDNKIIDPNDRARMADDLSKDDTLNSIQKAKMISRINKTGEVPRLG